MIFTVYRRDNEDRSRYVASCTYLDDAKTILDRWKAGFILDDKGCMIFIRKVNDENVQAIQYDDDRGACN